MKLIKVFSGINSDTDLIYCYRGLFVAIECKSDSGRQSPEQLDILNQIENAGGIALVNAPKTGAELKSLLPDNSVCYMREAARVTCVREKYPNLTR